MPQSPSGKRRERRDNAVVLTPAREVTTPSGSSKGRGKDLKKGELDPDYAPVTPNSKSRDDFENGHSRSRSKGQPENKDSSGWGYASGKGSAKGQAKGKGKGDTGKSSEGKSSDNVGEAQVTGTTKPAVAQPRIRDEIQEEVDSVVSRNSNLLKADFDGRVFQYLHAIHGVGGQEKVRKALEIIHLSTLNKQRSSIKKWPAYLATLLKKSFEDLGAEKQQDKDRARIEAENYGKQLTLSVDALFAKSVEIRASGAKDPTTPIASGNAANPQEADLGAAPEWLQKSVTEDREQEWLQRGSNILRSTLSISSPDAASMRSIPPGFTPPEIPSPAHAHGQPSLFSNSVSSPHQSGLGVISPPPGMAFHSTPPPQVPIPQLPFSPPPPPQLPSQPPPMPPTAAFQVHDPYKQQPTIAAQPPSPLHPPPPPQVVPKQHKQPSVIKPPPAAPSNGQRQQPHQPRVVPPPRRGPQPETTAANVGGAPPTVPPPPPPAPPPTEPAEQPEVSWNTNMPMLPPPWPAKYIPSA